jgi:hypothetical protein
MNSRSGAVTRTGESRLPPPADGFGKIGRISPAASPVCSIGELMNTQNFLLALGVGSALIAFWLALRFPDRGPADMSRALVHVGAAIGIGWFAPDIFNVFVVHGDATALTGIFLILLPVLVYTFLSGAWVLKIVHDMFSAYRH